MNITPVIEAIFALISVIITAVVIPYVRGKTTSTQQAEIATLVQVAVTAAEQIFTGTGQGKAKKEYVEVWLNSHGVTVDPDKLDAMIESAVYALKGATHEV